MKRALTALLAAAALLLPATAANAGGSDSPTPYTVTAEGITFPEPLAAHGHVNIRWTDPDGSAGIHFDPNNDQPGGAWIGQTFIPMSAFGVPEGACVTWVQWSGSNAHYGEGGQPPVCLTPPVAPEPVTVEVWWELPEPGTSESVTWPQRHLPDGQADLECDRWAQVDTYPEDEVAGLVEDGLLHEGEDWDVVLSWRFVYGGDCTPQIPEQPADLVDQSEDVHTLLECDLLQTTSTTTVTPHVWDGTAWVPGEPVVTEASSVRRISEGEALELGLPFECSDDVPPPVIEPPVVDDIEPVEDDAEQDTPRRTVTTSITPGHSAEQGAASSVQVEYDELAATGSTASGWALIAALLVGIGTVLTLASRRRSS